MAMHVIFYGQNMEVDTHDPRIYLTKKMTSPIVANTILSAYPPGLLTSKAWDIHWYSAVLSLIILHFHSLILR